MNIGDAGAAANDLKWSVPMRSVLNAVPDVSLTSGMRMTTRRIRKRPGGKSLMMTYEENDMDYVKDGTLTIQARTIKEVNSIDRVVVYADGCQREYLMPLPTIEERKEGKWIKRDKWLYCSACDDGGWGLGAVTYEWQYCPLCGAKIGE